MTAIVGIDLGTTHSLVGVYGAEGPRLLPNALGKWLTPSVVSVDDAGRVLVGQAARERLITAPGSTVAAFKRWMGTDRVTRLAGRDFRPEELSALVLKSLIADAENALGAAVTAGMKARDEKLEEIILTDVSPHTLGTEASRVEHYQSLRCTKSSCSGWW